MTTSQRAFYARTGSRSADLVTILHVPYTAWHLGYVAIGASLAPTFDRWRLLGTVLAFFFGMGVGAHAFDEIHDRPLATGLSDRTLWFLGWSGLGLAATVALVGAFVISPWVLAWAGVGAILAVTYPLELWRPVHTDVGFALSWGAFPVAVGYWAQSEQLTIPALLAAVAAMLLSLVQRSLSKSAKRIRRGAGGSGSDPATYETPLRLMTGAVVTVALVLTTIRW